MYILNYDENKPLKEQIRLLREDIQRALYEMEEKQKVLEARIEELEKDKK